MRSVRWLNCVRKSNVEFLKKNKRDDLYCSDEVAAKIQEELTQTKAYFLAGKIRAFDCAADFRKAVENGEI